MAIRNVVTGGVGLNNGVIGWAVTTGFGNLSVTTTPAAFPVSESGQWVHDINTSTAWATANWVAPPRVTTP